MERKYIFWHSGRGCLVGAAAVVATVVAGVASVVLLRAHGVGPLPTLACILLVVGPLMALSALADRHRP